MRLKFKRSQGLMVLALVSSLSVLGCKKNPVKDNSTPASSDVSSQFYSVVTFGDSLSDSGNVKYLTQQFAGDTSPLLKRSVPIDPTGNQSGYFNGRFSNSYNWLDRFIGALDLRAEDPETCFLKGSNASCNYAIGGSTTDENLTSDDNPLKHLFADDIVKNILKGLKIPQHLGVKQMVSTYLDASQPSQDVLNHTLFIIWAGGNDYFADENPSTTVSNLISSIKNILDYKPDNQKRYFLIPNLPDLGKTPYSAAHPTLDLSKKTAEHNSLFQQQLSELMLDPQYRDRVVIVPVDTANILGDAFEHPAQYGFTNVTDACYKGGYMPGEENTDCGDGDHYIFWDNIHITTRAHCLVTKVALQAMAAANLLDKPTVATDFNCDHL